VKVRAGRRSVPISHPDKRLFPSGVTKAELAEYYARVAPAMLPHVRGRPVSMQRFPDGVDKPGFFHKNVSDYFPDWIETVEVPKKGGTVKHAVCSDAATLVYLANQNTITPHVWLSRRDRLDRPDRLIFDLDPSREDFAEVRRAARDLGELLRELGLEPFAMVTGSRGVHVTVPLQRRARFDEVRAFADDAAELMASRHPDRLTTEFRKAKRGGRILLDVARNAWAQTAVPPYAVRARAEAPVAVPLEWRELGSSRLRPDGWTVRTLFRRLDRRGDPWNAIGASARPLGGPRRRLDELREREQG
jgi:bifunctional non-homologous end joining protein LigD